VSTITSSNAASANIHRENPIEDLGMELTFSTDDNRFGALTTIDLKPNGQNIDVTDENKSEYVKYVRFSILSKGL